MLPVVISRTITQKSPSTRRGNEIRPLGGDDKQAPGGEKSHIWTLLMGGDGNLVVLW